LLAPAAAASKGSVKWLVDGMPDVRLLPPDRDYAGRGWIGLVAHRDYLVNGVRQVALLPALLALALILAALLFAWRREGR